MSEYDKAKGYDSMLEYIKYATALNVLLLAAVLITQKGV